MPVGTVVSGPFGPLLGAVRISVALSERHTRSAAVTEHPIETGSEIADHRTISPEEYSIDGVVSDILAEDSSNPVANSSDAFQELLRMFDANDTFTVISGLIVYEDMVFKSFDVTRDKTTGQVVKFNGVIRRIKFADSKTVEVRQPTTKKVVTKTDLGPKDKKEASAEAKKDTGTTLRKLLNKAGGAGGLRDGANGMIDAIKQMTPFGN